MERFTGCGTALVTPFRRDGSLEEATLRKLVRRQIEAGVDFLVPCGTTGESPTLTREEHLRVAEITVEAANGKVPVLAGAGGYNTAEVIATARELAAIGVDGILSVTPYYNKPTQEGLYQHYKAIAAAVSLPIILYSVQGRTGVNIEPATVKRLAEIENIAGIKEASGNIAQMAAILNAVPNHFLVLSGDDSITLPLIALGGRGVISVGYLVERSAAHLDPDEVRAVRRIAASEPELDRPLVTKCRRVGERREIGGAIGDMDAVEQAVAAEITDLGTHEPLGGGRDEQNGAVAIVTRDHVGHIAGEQPIVVLLGIPTGA